MSAPLVPPARTRSVLVDIPHLLKNLLTKQRWIASFIQIAPTSDVHSDTQQCLHVGMALIAPRPIANSFIRKLCASSIHA
jgi:hypothetical protein